MPTTGAIGACSNEAGRAVVVHPRDGCCGWQGSEAGISYDRDVPVGVKPMAGKALSRARDHTSRCMDCRSFDGTGSRTGASPPKARRLRGPAFRKPPPGVPLWSLLPELVY